MTCPQVRKKAAAERKAAVEATVAGTWTMPDSGAASATDMAGNLVLASKMSSEAVRVKSYTGARRHHATLTSCRGSFIQVYACGVAYINIEVQLARPCSAKCSYTVVQCRLT